MEQHDAIGMLPALLLNVEPRCKVLSTVDVYLLSYRSQVVVIRVVHDIVLCPFVCLSVCRMLVLC